jgi:pumilio RNA-binding family
VCKLVSEFHDKVLLFIHDPNGNHVIQRCIQVMSAFPATTTSTPVENDDDGCNDADHPNNSTLNLSDQMQFIIDDLVANIEMLSTHRYGCRVVQRAVEHCEAAQKNVVLENIVSCLDSLIVDHYGENIAALSPHLLGCYCRCRFLTTFVCELLSLSLVLSPGNYVVQQVFVCGGEDHKAAILEMLTRDDSLLKFSKHKYASNVVETVLMHGQAHHKEIIMQEILKVSQQVCNQFVFTDI